MRLPRTGAPVTEKTPCRQSNLAVFITSVDIPKEARDLTSNRTALWAPHPGWHEGTNKESQVPHY